MEHTVLGGSGLRVPRIALGCGELGRRPGGREGVRLVAEALDMGITLFDTADVYADGESERILGEAVRERRDRCILATKFRHWPSALGGSRKTIRAALEGTLRRLGTDYVDLYQMHAPDPLTPIEETVSTLQDLVREGKVLYFGLCNVKAWQAVDAQHTARALGGAPLVSVQAQMSALDLSAFYELRPIAERFGFGLLCASPLARGLLSGAYSETRPPPEGHRLRTRKGAGYWNERGLAVAARIRSVAERVGRKPVHVALEALLSFEEVSAVLVGVSSLEQLRDLDGVKPGALDGLMVRDVLGGGATVTQTDVTSPIGAMQD